MLYNRRSALLLPLVAMLPAVSGCPQTPAVSIHHAEVNGVSTYGVGVVIYLQVHNDNPYDVQVRNVRCTVYFGRSAPIGPINYSPNQWLPANQTILVAVPASIPWAVVPGLASESNGALQIPYRVVGTADVTGGRSLGIDRNDYPIDTSGYVSRQLIVDSARRIMPIPF